MILTFTYIKRQHKTEYFMADSIRAPPDDAVYDASI